MSDEHRLRHCVRSGIVYQRHGSGRPVVLLHGWALDGRMWMYEDRLLAEDHDVIVADLPGLGRSDGIAPPYTLESHAAAIGDLLVENDLHGVVLVGFAYGGAVAMQVAAAEPARVAALALVGIPRAGELPDERMLRAMKRDWPEYARRSAQALCKQPQSDATLRWLESMFLATRLEAALETWESVSHFDPLALAGRLPMPALFVHGEQDDFSPLAVAREAAEAAPAGRLAVASPSGHLVLLDQPEWLHHTLHAFIQEASLS